MHPLPVQQLGSPRQDERHSLQRSRHCPATQDRPARQEPQLPPQPSSPQSFPSQLGVHAQHFAPDGAAEPA
jgi:hypothetical protein